MKKCFTVLSGLLLLIGSVARGQSLEETMQKLAEDGAKSYVGPLVSGFGADLNAGWFHKAPSAKMLGFDLEFGVVAMGTFFSDENKHFASSGVFQFDSTQAASMTDFMKNDPQYGLTQSQRDAVQRAVIDEIRGVNFTVGLSGPTIIGPKDDSLMIGFSGHDFTVTDPNTGLSRTVSVPQQNIALPIGGVMEGLKLMPLAAPQLSLGTFVGTQFTFRWLPSYEINNIGKAKYFGFGIQHNPGLWLANPLPVDVSVGYFTQTLSVGSLFKTSTNMFGVNVSKRFGPGAVNVTPYAGLSFESSKMTFTYDYTIDTKAGPVPEHVSFDLKGENKTRLTLGLSIKLLFLNINADYNLGKYNNASAGLMFII